MRKRERKDARTQHKRGSEMRNETRGNKKEEARNAKRGKNVDGE